MLYRLKLNTLGSPTRQTYEQDFNRVERERQEVVLQAEKPKAALQTLKDAWVREINKVDQKGYAAGYDETEKVYKKQVRETKADLYKSRFWARMEYLHAQIATKVDLPTELQATSKPPAAKLNPLEPEIFVDGMEVQGEHCPLGSCSAPPQSPVLLFVF